MAGCCGNQSNNNKSKSKRVTLTTILAIIAVVIIAGVLQGCSRDGGLSIVSGSESNTNEPQAMAGDEGRSNTSDFINDDFNTGDAEFYDGFITDEQDTLPSTINTVKAAELVGDIQEITIAVENGDFSVDAIVLQSDRDFIVKFDVLNEPDLERIEEDWYYAAEYFVNFPGYGGGIDLVYENETPALPPVIGNFVFGDVFLESVVIAVLVPDVNNYDEASVISIAADFLTEGLSGSGFACH